MSIYQGTGLAEGASVTRPPLFDGKNYSYWKIECARFYNLWIMSNGRLLLLDPMR